MSHYRLRMMSTVFDKWSFRKKAVISRKQRIQQAVSHHDNQVVGAVWSAWIKVTDYLFVHVYVEVDTVTVNLYTYIH